jgi:hypothetical protein
VADAIRYCELCNRRVTRDDVDAGVAIVGRHFAVCGPCVTGLPGPQREALRERAGRAPSESSSIMSQTEESGARRPAVPPAARTLSATPPAKPQPPVEAWAEGGPRPARHHRRTTGGQRNVSDGARGKGGGAFFGIAIGVGVMGGAIVTIVLLTSGQAPNRRRRPPPSHSVHAPSAEAAQPPSWQPVADSARSTSEARPPAPIEMPSDRVPAGTIRATEPPPTESSDEVIAVSQYEVARRAAEDYARSGKLDEALDHLAHAEKRIAGTKWYAEVGKDKLRELRAGLQRVATARAEDERKRREALREALASGDADRVTLGLAGWWKFDGQGDVAFADRSGNGHALVPKHGARLVEGRGGTVAELDGTDDYFVIASPGEMLRNVPAATLCAWVRPDRLSGKQSVAFVGTEKATSSTRAQIRINGAKAELCGRSAAEDAFVAGGGGQCRAGHWQHLAGVINYSHGSLSVYVDGRLVYFDENEKKFKARHTADAASLVASIGCDSHGNGEYFDGSIDEVRIYRRALGPLEILSLANAGK